MEGPANMFVAEYASRPDLASIFYEDVLMCAFFYGYPLLVENNKYGIVRYFESRGYDGYLMDRPDFLKVPGSSKNVRTKGIPSNSPGRDTVSRSGYRSLHTQPRRHQTRV